MTTIGDDTRYIAFTTYRRSGEAVPTPVWVVTLADGSLGFHTGSQTGKVKRLRHTPRALLQPSDRTGDPLPGSDPVEVHCELVDGATLEEINRAVVAKYGRVQTTLARVVATVAGLVTQRRRVPYSDVGVRFRLAD